MTEPITVSTFFPELLRSVPEFERCAARERESAEEPSPRRTSFSASSARPLTPTRGLPSAR